jgi:hypothetical protein
MTLIKAFKPFSLENSRATLAIILFDMHLEN